MPSNVSWFEKLMYTTLLMGIGLIALDGPRMAAKPEVAASGGLQFMIIVGILTALVMILLIWLIARRQKNWARWLLAVLFVLGTIPAVPLLIELIQANPLAGAISFTQTIVQVVALILVFSGNARPWFAKSASTIYKS